MTNSAYDYYGLFAHTWDVWRDGTANWADRFFFFEIAQQYGNPVLDVGCGTVLMFDKPRPADGAIVRSWGREWCVPEHQLWHTEQRFEVELNGQIIQADHQVRSPEGRWYSQAQAIQLLREAGITDVQLFHEYTHEPALETDRLFCAVGIKRSHGVIT